MSYNKAMGKLLNAVLGYRGLKSYADLCTKGSVNVWGRSENSAPTLTHHINNEGKIYFVETNTTYFKPMPQVTDLNRYLEENGPQDTQTVIGYVSMTKR